MVLPKLEARVMKSEMETEPSKLRSPGMTYSAAPISTRWPTMRGKPRWSVVMPLGIRELEPVLIRGLPDCGSMVWVGPPLLARGPRRRLAPKGRLLPLEADIVKPVALPMAL